MPTQDSPDYLSQLSGLINQPIQPTQPTLPAPDNTNSGWGHKTAGIAQLATNFLAGAAKGRAQAYDRQQQADAKQGQYIELALHQIDASGASDDVKTAERQKLMTLMGQMVYGSLPDSKSSKGKDKASANPDPLMQYGGAPNPDAQDPKNHPVLGAMKGLLEGLLGPAAKKNSITPEMVNATVGQSLIAVKLAENSQKAFTHSVEQPFMDAVTELEKKLGHPATFAEIEADPKARDAAAQNAIANNNQFTSGVATKIQAAKELEKEQQAAKIEGMKEDEKDKENKAKLAQHDKDNEAKMERLEKTEKGKFDRLKTLEEGRDKRFIAQQQRLNRIAAMKASGGANTPSKVKDVVEGIKSGILPPDLKGFYKDKMPIEAELAKQGINLSKLQREWSAVNRHLATMNGQKQTTLIQNLNTLSDTIPSIEDAYAEWQKTELPSGYKLWNKAALTAAANGEGPSSVAAQRVISLINDMSAEIGSVYMGGNSNTDESLRKASENLKAEWNEETFHALLKTLETNLEIRRNNVLHSPVLGIDSDSPYLDQSDKGGGSTAASGNKSAITPSLGTSGQDPRLKGIDSKWHDIIINTLPPLPGQQQTKQNKPAAQQPSATAPPPAAAKTPPPSARPDPSGLFPEFHQ